MKINFTKYLQKETVVSSNSIHLTTTTQFHTQIQKDLLVCENEEDLDKLVFFAELSNDIALQIFSLFNERCFLSSCTRVCKAWYFSMKHSNPIWDAIRPQNIFGKKEWEKYLKETWEKSFDVGEEPLLPSNTDVLLESPCPFFPEEKIKDTHMLTLIPEYVNGKEVNLSSFNELLHNPDSFWLHRLVEKSPSSTTGCQSHWVLMLKKEIPGTRGQTFDENKAYIDCKNGYELPHALDAAISLYMNFIMHDVKKSLSVRCQEMVDVHDQRYSGSYPIAVTLLNGPTVYIRDGSLGNPMYSFGASRKIIAL